MRRAVAVVMVVAAALAALPPSISRSRAVVASRPALGDDLSVYDQRVRVVREALQGRHSRVGYLPPSALRGDPRAIANDIYFLSLRYLLAPTLVVPRADLPLVVTDLVAEPVPTPLPADFVVEQDFGNRLLLLLRTPR